MCVCETERERERECVCERERDKERVSLYVCILIRETWHVAIGIMTSVC